MITIKSVIAIDTNVILYGFDEDLQSAKKLTALDIIGAYPHFSSQVLSEVINVCHKKMEIQQEQIN